MERIENMFRTKKFDLSSIKEYRWLIKQDDLKQLVLATPHVEERQREANRIIRLHVLNPNKKYGSIISDFVYTMKSRGFDNTQIETMFSNAWLNGVDYIDYPSKTLAEYSKSQIIYWFLASLFSLIATWITINSLRRVGPAMYEYLLAFPPLLGLMGYTYLILILTLIKLFRKRFLNE